MAKDEQTTVTVPITVEERAERADIMAGLVAQIGAVKAQAKAKAFEFRGVVEALEERLAEHARVIRAGEEERNQLHLTFPQEEAARALHDVAKAACTCPDPANPDNHSPACPVHGVDAKPKLSAACDGDHAAPRCADPECWLIEGPAEDEANVGAATVEHVDEILGEQVDVGTVEEPASVADFQAEKARRAQ
jgi:hypothetical protein